MFDNAPPITLANLSEGPHSVEVVGRNSGGDWQEIPAKSKTWNVLQLPPADSDNDGMPDTWEIIHGLDPANPADALSDADGDAQHNLSEFTAGTNPRDPASRFAATVDLLTGGFPVIEFSALSGRTYRIDAADSPAATTWTEIARFAPDSDGSITHADTTSPQPNRRFYRVVTPAP
jgi:hypothetical protein